MKRRFANQANDGNNIYKQIRVDEEFFKGYVCLLKLINVKEPWIINDPDFTGCILDENYEWLEVYPDNENYAITIIFDDKKNLIEWYFDMSKKIGIESGIPYEDDLYLDFVIRANGNYIVLDEDELENAFKENDITKEDYDLAYKTMYSIKDKYTNDLKSLEILTKKIYSMFNK